MFFFVTWFKTFLVLCYFLFLSFRLTCSEALGDALYDYGETELQDFETCMALAQTVYNKCGVHKKAVLCMCMVGELTGAMEYIHDSKRFSLGKNSNEFIIFCWLKLLLWEILNDNFFLNMFFLRFTIATFPFLSNLLWRWITVYWTTS